MYNNVIKIEFLKPYKYFTAQKQSESSDTTYCVNFLSQEERRTSILWKLFDVDTPEKSLCGETFVTFTKWWIFHKEECYPKCLNI